MPGSASHPVLRSAVVFGARFVFVVGQRYRRTASDTLNAVNAVPIFEVADESELLQRLPKDIQIVVMELSETAKPLPHFDHPVRAVYLFGPEDGNVPTQFMEKSVLVQIPGKSSLNLGTAAGITMYDRVAKRARMYRRHEISRGAAVGYDG